MAEVTKPIPVPSDYDIRHNHSFIIVTFTAFFLFLLNKRGYVEGHFYVTLLTVYSAIIICSKIIHFQNYKMETLPY